jgi:hypothetical protein
VLFWSRFKNSTREARFCASLKVDHAAVCWLKSATGPELGSWDLLGQAMIGLSGAATKQFSESIRTR